ncbi:MAG TPA: hypothetical protein VG389_29140 [Myxococcota bacterium]|jgi:hypothetical protein|nr:hypothetical protein [Myxococcota bacterium]
MPDDEHEPTHATRRGARLVLPLLLGLAGCVHAPALAPAGARASPAPAPTSVPASAAASAASAPARSSAPSGLADCLSALPVTLDLPAPFEVQVRRDAGGPDQARALCLAEAAYPPRADVLAAIDGAHFKLGAVPSDARLWWYSAFDGVRLAYAVTGDALRYYLDLTTAFARGERAPAGAAVKMLASRLEYAATVRRARTFTRDGRTFADVWVVEMRLDWRDYCGPLCAMGFGKTRTVVLSAAGEVLALFGDGPAAAVVS